MTTPGLFVCPCPRPLPRPLPLLLPLIETGEPNPTSHVCPVPIPASNQVIRHPTLLRPVVKHPFVSAHLSLCLQATATFLMSKTDRAPRTLILVSIYISGS